MLPYLRNDTTSTDIRTHTDVWSARTPVRVSDSLTTATKMEVTAAHWDMAREVLNQATDTNTMKSLRVVVMSVVGSTPSRRTPTNDANCPSAPQTQKMRMSALMSG